MCETARWCVWTTEQTILNRSGTRCEKDEPLKKQPAIEEINDIKRSLDFLSEEITTVRLQQKSILDLVAEVKALQLQNEEKDKRLAFLENRVADLEQ